MKRILALFFAVVLALSFAGCNFSPDMPFNAEVTFHELTVLIPDGFIRDSAQSQEDTWLFEKGFYSQRIILTRSDITGDTEASLENYVAYMQGNGADSQKTVFLEKGAVLSVYTRDGVECRELLVAHNGSFYAIALRGGTEEAFKTLLDSAEFATAKAAL